MDDAETCPDEEPVIRAIAMPRDTNPEGDIFGGWLMAQMDLAGASLAFDLAKGRCATVAVDGMTFLNPVSVGDEVSLTERGDHVRQPLNLPDRDLPYPLRQPLAHEGQPTEPARTRRPARGRTAGGGVRRPRRTRRRTGRR